MKKTIASILIGIGLLVGAGSVATFVTTPIAQAGGIKDGMAPTTSGTKLGGKKVTGLVKKTVNILLFVIGAVSVIMVIVGGIQFTTSAGDASKAKTAKNTILYAVVGVVIAMFAYAIINYVVDKV